MWFKNLTIFQCEEKFEYDVETLQDRLSETVTRPCGNTETFTYGWASPLGDNSDVLALQASDCLLICARKQERLLPASIVRDALNKRVTEIETNETRKIYSKEKSQMRDQITFELLPQAFIKQQSTNLYIDKKLGLIMVDTTNASRAEAVTELLRKALGSLKISLLETNSSPNVIMTNWLLEKKLPAHFVIEDQCTLLDVKRGSGMIKCQQQDLFSHEITEHLNAGKQITELSLTWQDRLTFTISQDLKIKRIKPLEIIKDNEEEFDDSTQQILADFLLMSQVFSELVSDIFTVFDGVCSVAGATA